MLSGTFPIGTDYTSNQWTAFWAGVTAIATVLVAMVAVVVFVVELRRYSTLDAQRKAADATTAAALASEERAKRHDRHVAAIQRAASLHVGNLGEDEFSLRNEGNDLAFTEVVVDRWDYGEPEVDPEHGEVRHVEEVFSLNLAPIGPGVALRLKPECYYWKIRYSDPMGYRFERDAEGPPIIIDDPLDSATATD